jgi:hypothetical protein
MTRYGEKKKYDPETGKKTTASRFQTRLRNTLGFADFIKNAEAETGKPAILVAHNLPYDAKAIGSEFERARKEAWELRKEKITSYDEYAWMKDTLSATYPGLDTVQIFKQVLKPIVEKLKYFVETGVATEEEAAIVDNMITKAGNVSVSLGPTRQAFGVEDKGWHDALADVEMTMEVFDVVRMFIANYDPSLEEPEQMKLPFGEEGKNPEEDPQLTDHLREGDILEITKSRLQEIIREERFKIEGVGIGPGRDRKYDEEVRPTVEMEEDLVGDSTKAEEAEAAQAAAQGGGVGGGSEESGEEEKKDDDLMAIGLEEADAELTRDEVKSIVKSELQSLLKSLKRGEPELEEKLKPSMGAGEYVEDFYKSDAPQFKGKSKKKRQKMAIAAYLDDKRGSKK